MYYFYLALSISVLINLILLITIFVVYIVQFKENIFENFSSEPIYETILLSLLMLTVVPFTLWLCCSIYKNDLLLLKIQREEERKHLGGNLKNLEEIYEYTKYIISHM